MYCNAFTISILGSNAAKPSAKRNPSGQLLQYANFYALIDCGEGTQQQLLKYGLKTSRITHIFISHLHGDHFLGLMPLLDSYALSNRTSDLHIFSPSANLKVYFEMHTQISQAHYPYHIEFHVVNPNETAIIFKNDLLTVRTIPLKHTAPCCGYLFTEKQLERKFLIEFQEEYAIHFSKIPDIKKGADYVCPNGQIVPNEQITLPPPPSRSYAYCSDTSFYPSIASAIKGVNLLYHETTYLDELQTRAEQRGHSTTTDAAKIAKQAQAKQLLIGHFSTAYNDLAPFLAEATNIFSNTALAIDGQTFTIE
ncbi:MAG: ribonuclease Z [Sphingobacteriales bacterium]|jgi:ribonuclease Z|nr:ribonuclease Z [Sphingobacteriales bacterium]MBP9141621.1 ribonuclease Z [Chitinophagales bacterium]MDA0198539.1 ribonuclease Z [Bacteroidota bacterium]MBK6888702.1 ribonuclease Z [Sphingobacteriales bacterium]MBK7528792.1 ribonuclease Z [Sphingobacteriales bacterium]